MKITGIDFLIRVLVLSVMFCAVETSYAIRLTFNNSSEFNDSEVYVWFSGAADSSIKLSGESQNLSFGTSYPLTALGAGVEVDRLVSGRVYLSLGAPLENSALNPQGVPLNQPGVLPGRIGYGVRYDFMELTHTPNPADVADLTSMDQFGLPIHLQLKANGTALTGPGTSAGWKGHSDQAIVSQLSAMVSPAGDNVVLNEDGQFVRVNGATSFARLYQNNPSDARSMNAYLASIASEQGEKGPLIIKGRFSAEIDYEYSAALDAEGNYVLTQIGGTSSNPDKIAVPVSYKNGPNPDDPTITLAEAIYLSDPHYSVDDGPLQPTANDVTGAVARDLFAALNLGYVSSSHLITAEETADPSLVGKHIYELNTEQMRNLKIAFEEVNEFYNIYANEIRKLSDSYGYAYSDWNEHLSKVTVSLNADHGGQVADELNIEFFGSYQVIPEPSGAALILAGTLLLVARRRRR